MRPTRRRMPLLLGIISLHIFLLGGCSLLADLPRDARGSISKLQAGQPLVVGVPAQNEEDDAPVAAREKALLQKLASRLGTRIEWKRGNTHRLLEDLEQAQVLVVAAQLPSDTPFAQHVALSQPFWKKGPREKDFCFALAPGENRLMLELDRLILEEQGKKEGDRS
jgi:hypothetical protein